MAKKPMEPPIRNNMLGVIYPDDQMDSMPRNGNMMNGLDLDALANKIAILVARRLALDSEAEDVGQMPASPKDWYKTLKQSYKDEIMEGVAEEIMDEMEEDTSEEEDMSEEESTKEKSISKSLKLNPTTLDIGDMPNNPRKWWTDTKKSYKG